MGGPRKTSWFNPDELAEVCASLFNSLDPLSHAEAVSRIDVWLQRGSCPHAVESTANFFRLMLRDAAMPRISAAEQRLAYAMALIRFVNTLIDPLQNAYYAKSMASLAAQLGLPLWFIELRHAATHEDLPSLEVLRDASRQAIDFLYNSYWLPALSSKPPPLELDSLRQVLKVYKEMSKAVLRDQSRLRECQPIIDRSLRDVEGWLASHAITHGSDVALEALVDTLTEEGYLVPLAHSKRPGVRSTQLPAALVDLWMPLLDQLDATNDAFSDSLLMRLTTRLDTGDGPFAMPMAQSQQEDTMKKADNYYTTCICWIVHLLNDDDAPQAKKDVLRAALSCATSHSLKLVSMLVENDSETRARVEPLLTSLRSNDLTQPLGSADEVEQALDEMEQRVVELERSLAAKRHTAHVSQALPGQSKSGWRLVEGWSPRPIGALPKSGGRAHSLILPARPAVIS